MDIKPLNESNIFGISVRAIIAFTLVVTVCIMSVMKIQVIEPLYSLAVMAAGFYLGAKTNGGEKQ